METEKGIPRPFKGVSLAAQPYEMATRMAFDDGMSRSAFLASLILREHTKRLTKPKETRKCGSSPKSCSTQSASESSPCAQ
jgi:hypothetical protein